MLEPCLVVIPARGGSKGLPKKNIRPLMGIPLIGHSIRCARLSGRNLRVVVSTDSSEIAEVARQEGADVPFLRPAELAQDDTPMMPVLSHALEAMEKLDGTKYPTLMLLDPTSPGRLPSDMDAAFRRLAEDPTADGVIACSRPTFNPLWVGVFEKNGVIEAAFPQDKVYTRRQDVPPFYRIHGGLYVWRRAFIAGRPKRATDGRMLFLETPETRSFSIDDEAEFEAASALIERGIIQLPWLESTAENKR